MYFFKMYFLRVSQNRFIWREWLNTSSILFKFNLNGSLHGGKFAQWEVSHRLYLTHGSNCLKTNLLLEIDILDLVLHALAMDFKRCYEFLKRLIWVPKSIFVRGFKQRNLLTVVLVFLSQHQDQFIPTFDIFYRGFSILNVQNFYIDIGWKFDGSFRHILRPGNYIWSLG